MPSMWGWAMPVCCAAARTVARSRTITAASRLSLWILTESPSGVLHAQRPSDLKLLAACRGWRYNAASRGADSPTAKRALRLLRLRSELPPPAVGVLKEPQKISKRSAAMPSIQTQVYEFGPFRLDCAEQRLLRHNQPVALTPRALNLLKVLVQHAGHLVTKEDLLRTLWPESFVEEANLSVNVSAVRRAIGDGQTGQAQYIETVPKLGYRFIAPVRQVAPSATQQLPRPVRRKTVAAGALAALVLLAVATWLASRPTHRVMV